MVIAFSNISIGQVPAPADSDDRAYVGQNGVVVLDGASAFHPMQTSGRSYAQELGHELITRITNCAGEDLTHLLSEAITNVARRLALTPGVGPSATVSIVRIDAELLDVLVLGDSPVLVRQGATWDRISDNRLDQLDLPESRHYRSRLAQGAGYGTEHRRLLTALQTRQAEFRNTDQGYWIAEADPRAAYHAITRTFPAGQVTGAVILTDGADRTMAHLGLTDWDGLLHADSNELTTVLRRCQEWEAAEDPHGVQLPRAKRHDDKTLVTLTIGTETPMPVLSRSDMYEGPTL